MSYEYIQVRHCVFFKYSLYLFFYIIIIIKCNGMHNPPILGSTTTNFVFSCKLWSFLFCFAWNNCFLKNPSSPKPRFWVLCTHTHRVLRPIWRFPTFGSLIGHNVWSNTKEDYTLDRFCNNKKVVWSDTLLFVTDKCSLIWSFSGCELCSTKKWWLVKEGRFDARHNT